MTGGPSPQTDEVDTDMKTENNGLLPSFERLISVFESRSMSKARLYIGSGSISLSLLLIVGGVGSYGYTLRLPPGTVRYWLALEAAYGAIAASVPFLLVGATVLFASSKRLPLGAGIGAVVCLSAVGLFIMTFPGNWQLNTQSPTFWVLGLYGLGLVLLVLCAGIAIGGRQKPDHQRSRDPIESDSTAKPATVSNTGQTDEGGYGPSVGTKAKGGAGLSDLHSTLVAAPSVTLTSKAAQIGEQWVKTVVIVDYPDKATTGMLDRAITRVPDIDLDYSIHIKPRDPTKTIGELKNSIRDLKVKQAEKSERGDVTQIDTEQTLADHQAIYSQLVGGSQQIFDVSIYLTVRGENREEVEQAAERVTRNLQSSQLTA